MIRREIIKLIGLGGAWLLTDRKALGRTLEKPSQIELLRSFVAGYQYHQGATVENELLPETPLLLRREPENRYDDQAIAIYYGEVRIGYIPRYENPVLARLLDGGVELQAKVATVDLKAPTWERVEVVVSVEVGGAGLKVWKDIQPLKTL